VHPFQMSRMLRIGLICAVKLSSNMNEYTRIPVLKMTFSTCSLSLFREFFIKYNDAPFQYNLISYLALNLRFSYLTQFGRRASNNARLQLIYTAVLNFIVYIILT
jgi:hypothetical protein